MIKNTQIGTQEEVEKFIAETLTQFVEHPRHATSAYASYIIPLFGCYKELKDILHSTSNHEEL